MDENKQEDRNESEMGTERDRNSSDGNNRVVEERERKMAQME